MAIKKTSAKGGRKGSGKGWRRRKLGLILSKDTVSTCLYDDDATTVNSYVTGGEGKKSDVLRALIHEAILARELRKSGNREADKQIRKLHEEAVEVGTQGIYKMLEELLTIGRRLNVGFENLLAGSDTNFGVLFEILKLNEGISSMVLNDLTKPAMLKKAKDVGEVEGTIEELKGRFEDRAVEKIDQVKKDVRASTMRGDVTA